MPATWGESLRGAAGPDLSSARTLSSRTYMWVPRQVGGGLLGSFSRLIMRSRVEALARPEWPDGLASKSAAGAVYALDELVLDMPSVLEALRANHRDRIRKIPDPSALSFSQQDGQLQVGDLAVQAQRIVLAAGAGNAELLGRSGIDDLGHQRRPLHQLLIAGMKQPLYAHCVGKSTKPLATVTSHPSAPGGQGDYVWYVGGLMAESGVAESETELIQRAQRELPRLFPAADFGAARWATFRIDRAEGSSGGSRPTGATVDARGRCIVVWPTKLTLAPAMSERVIQLLAHQHVTPGDTRDMQIEALAGLSEPDVARPPWEGVETWT
jgi:glycine/D-amino acid oxidase-like deaminating enzyme